MSKSNYEINKAVAEKLGHKVAVRDFCVDGYSAHHYTWVKELETGDSYTLPDYCNSWADAGPIIHKYGISIIRIVDAAKWLSASDSSFETISMRPDGNDNGISCFYCKNENYNTNPLPAAMLVFLDMDITVRGDA